MAANFNVGFSYRPGFSTAAVIFTGPEDAPRILSRVGADTLFYGPFHCSADSTRVCSSSDGLVALYDAETHIYHIGNPLIPGQESYRTPLQGAPRRHDPPENTHVVLATDFSNPDLPVYHLVCAFKDEDRDDSYYTLDTYSSLRGSWRSYTNIQLTWGGTIRPNTGVSCDRFIYWLTMRPCVVVCFDVNNIGRQPAAWWDPPVGIDVLALPATRLQLGRIQNQVGLVVVDAKDRTVKLYLLKPGAWVLYARMNLLILQPSFTGQLQEDGSGGPEPLRFQSSKLEVFFRVRGLVKLWESDSTNPERTRTIVFPGGGLRTGTSHVGTSLLPGIFPLMPPDQDMDQADNDDRESLASCSSPPSDGN